MVIIYVKKREINLKIHSKAARCYMGYMIYIYTPKYNSLWCMVGFWHWHIPTFIITDISPPWWDFVMVGMCWVTFMIMIIMRIKGLTMIISTIFRLYQHGLPTILYCEEITSCSRHSSCLEENQQFFSFINTAYCGVFQLHQYYRNDPEWLTLHCTMCTLFSW